MYRATELPAGPIYGTRVTNTTLRLYIIQVPCVQFEERSFIHAGVSFPVAYTLASYAATCVGGLILIPLQPLKI